LLTGFFVAAEFALVKVRSTRLSELAQAGNQNAARAVRALAHINDYLSATQLGITVCTLVLGNIGETAVESLLHPMFLKVPISIRHTLTSGVALTFVMMLEVIIGEMAPKTLAIKQAEKITLALILPLTVFTKIFRPLIVLMNAIASLVLDSRIGMESCHSRPRLLTFTSKGCDDSTARRHLCGFHASSTRHCQARVGIRTYAISCDS
ncbi:MAG: hypothetical protein RLZZ78_1958, partial [Armatimonadota bacterium]